MTAQIYSKSFKLCTSSIRRIREHMGLILIKLNITKADIQNYQLLVSEWITNLIKHCKKKSDNIKISIQFNKQTLVFTIIDGCDYFADFYHCIAKATSPPDLGENGYGLYLLARYKEQITYTQEDHNNYFAIKIKHTDLSNRKPHIALIDDDESIHLIVREFLKDNYIVSSFYSAEEFLETVADNKIDAVICDIGLPAHSGFELREILLERKIMTSTPFIFLTGYKNTKLEEFASHSVVDDFLIKPITKKKLLNVLSRILVRIESLKQEITAEFAYSVQQSLRSNINWQTPEVTIQSYVQSRPMGGGDFILEFPIEHGKRIIIADVMGHNLSSKFFVYSFCGYIRAIMQSMVSQALPLAEFAQSISSAIQQDKMLDNTFLTFSMIDVKPNHISILNAGSPKPLCKQSNQVTELPITGMVPGITDFNYEVMSYNNLKNTRFVFYTDGLMEIGLDTACMQQNKQAIMTLFTESLSDDEFLPQLKNMLETKKYIELEDDISVVTVAFA